MGMALHLNYQGREVLLLPPLRRLAAADLALAPESQLEVLVIPGELADSQGCDPLLARLRPQKLVIYGGFGRHFKAAGHPAAIPCYFTREGAVSVYLSPAGAFIRQWRP